MTPMIMMTHPAVWMLKTEVLVVTANARMAPRQMNPRPIPVFIDSRSFRGGSGRRYGASECLRRRCGRAGGHRLGGPPAAGRNRGVGRVEEPAPQVAERAREQPGHVHLR